MNAKPWPMTYISASSYSCNDLSLRNSDPVQLFLKVYRNTINTKVGSKTSFKVFSERELKFMFAIGYRPSVCLSVCLSVCRLSVTLVHPTQAIEIFRNISTPCGTLAIHELCIKILRRSSQGNPSVGGVNQKRGSRI